MATQWWKNEIAERFDICKYSNFFPRQTLCFKSFDDWKLEKGVQKQRKRERECVYLSVCVCVCVLVRKRPGLNNCNFTVPHQYYYCTFEVVTHKYKLHRLRLWKALFEILKDLIFWTIIFTSTCPSSAARTTFSHHLLSQSDDRPCEVGHGLDHLHQHFLARHELEPIQLRALIELQAFFSFFENFV